MLAEILGFGSGLSGAPDAYLKEIRARDTRGFGADDVNCAKVLCVDVVG